MRLTYSVYENKTYKLHINCSKALKTVVYLKEKNWCVYKNALDILKCVEIYNKFIHMYM